MSPDRLYEGHVSHVRLRPVTHALRYRVFALLLDVEALPGLGRRHRLLSHNRRNLFEIRDADHGDGTPLAGWLRRLAQESPEGRQVVRFAMLCYPRVLGYVFNPITVYYGYDAGGRIRLMIYEVNNTFGQRRTYVLPATPDAHGHVHQGCEKALYVSPFNDVSGRYSFNLDTPGAALALGVALRDSGGALLKAHFAARGRTLSDRALLGATLRTGWLTAKVMTGIHWEALRLWLKGLRPRPRPRGPKAAVSHAPAPAVQETDACSRN
ncbi:DUF1365 domain-containing protein [Paroceanicella profunda]|uniref:DUF1365 domain-containing protein n=1 Tax=Paroceanicella profunda TaxID=2579971 RepID=A0A5B8FGU9_9RHOB|nr:DUF1365 domain-containing protein [Paroceanicella profunda]QDL91661.1 DUF1365 domain-containing protein [Paroceanicella profunda]